MTDRARPDTRPPGRTRQWAVDAAIAVAVTALQLYATYASSSWSSWSGHHHHQTADWYVYVLLAVAGLALIARRRYPVEVLAVSLAATLAAGRLGGGLIWLALIVAFLNAAIARKRAAAVASVVIGYLASTWPPWRIGTAGHASTAAAVGIAAWLIVLVAITELVRIRGQRSAALKRSQEEEFRRRAGEDRMRIARDLHDVLAHNISVINVQANTALHLMDRQPDRAKEALTAIHGVSKQALSELRAVLGVLREEGPDGAPRSPSPGLAGLDDLLASARSAELDVRLTMEGEPRPLPADADIAAYRIVQESLTNVRKHSGAGAAFVRVRYEPAGVRLEVEDPGPAGPGAANGSHGTWTGSRGAGTGIRGMAERVVELGGTFDAGPRTTGGFRVTAWLPAEQADMAARADA
jgi:signal transduction histidine kinase